MSVTISNPSIVHTFGNVACVAVEYMKSFFPEDFFTKVHVSTKMSHRQLDVFRAKPGFWKNKKPMLVLRPRIDWDNTGNWFYGSAMMNRWTHGRSPMEFADLVTLIKDEETATLVQFLWNRYRVVYDCVIVLETYNQQVNIMNDLRNRLDIEVPYPLRTTLEAYLPKSIVYSIADNVGIPRDDTARILEYLNTYSEAPITYKLHKGSGNHEFFMMYPTNIEVISSDVSPDDGDTRGVVTDTYTIGLSVSMEFNAVGVWYTFLMDGIDERRQAPMDEICDIHGNKQNGDTIIPISSIPLGFDLGLEKGWKILEAPFFFPEPDKDGVDTTDISSILDQVSVKALILHHEKMNIPLDGFLQFRVFAGTRELSRGKGENGYDISFEKRCIYIYHPNVYESHRIFVLINSMAINNMATEITNFDKA